MTRAERNSSFELLRICAMFIIVLYHMYLYNLPDLRCPEHPFISAFFPLLHVGVPLFVLISGYFGIKPTWKGLLTIISVVVVYHIPLLLYHDLRHGLNIHTFLFISDAGFYWFVRAYLFLYITAPILNQALQSMDKKRCLIWILILSIISIYFGYFDQEGSLSGKSLLNFWLIYSIGYYIHNHVQETQIPVPTVLFALLILNMLISTTLYYSINNAAVFESIMRLSFYYNSIGLILNALLIFLLFTKIKMASKVVNYISSSMFAVYIIHEQPLIRNIISSHVHANDLVNSGGGIIRGDNSSYWLCVYR